MKELVSESPRITRVSWGAMEVDGLGRFKDVKLWPGGGREWDWRETGTRHVPGIQVADIQELIDHGARVVALTRGMALRLETAPGTVAFLQEHGIDVHVEETQKAVALYNQLAEQGEAVAGLFHSTC